MTEGQKPDDKAEIEGILADLESILSEKAPDEAKPKSEPGIANIIAGLGDALKHAQGPPLPAQAQPPPLIDPQPTIPVSKPPLQPPQAGPPAARPPGAKPPPVPPLQKPPFDIRLDVPPPRSSKETPESPSTPPSAAPPQAKPPSVVPPPLQAHPPIGSIPPAQPPPQAAPPAAKPPAQAAPPVVKPLVQPPPAQAVPPVVKPPVQAVPPVVKPLVQPPPAQAVPPVVKPPLSVPPAAKPPVVPAQAAASAPAPQVPPQQPMPSAGVGPKSFVAPPGAIAEIPAEAPKDQVRRVAFLYGAGQKVSFVEFIKFVDTLALQFSKKPLYLRKVYMAEISADNELQAVVEKIKASGAVGVVGVLPGMQENKIRAFEGVLSAANISFYWLTAEEAFKRPVVLGLVVELMLLNAE